MAKVKNPGPNSHRVSGIYFEPGKVVECPDEVALFVVRSMGFERVPDAPKSIAEGGSPATKPGKARGK